MKRLILCCDGTWNRADQEFDGEPCPTNVVKLASRTAKRGADGVLQVVYYDQGVGTGNALDRFSGGAFGSGLEENIHDAYRFLIGNYEEGDEIFLFGFSRGAFTVRSIAGMIRNCGILRRESVAQYRAAIQLYQDHERNPDHPFSLEFKAKHSVCTTGDVPIRCVGVWDTVGSRGIPLRGLRMLTRRKYQFHDTELSGTVEFAFHALAIDEKRAPFEPTLWDDEPTPDRPDRTLPKPGQTVEQVWFCGVHSDVGGGYPEAGLSDLALEWMIDRARSAGLAFDAHTMAALPTRGSARAKLHESKTGMYRVTRGIERPIRRTATQSLHPSVLERWDADPGYRPANLQRHLAEIGDPRARA